MTTTERAAAIRTALKAKGITSRQVSVRADYFSMGSSIDVTVKDPRIPLATVKAVADEHESIRRCEFSGEILGGGNRYLHVAYSYEAIDQIAAQWLPAVTAAVETLASSGENSLIPVAGTPFLIGRSNYGDRHHAFSVWGDSHIQSGCSAKGAAATIGVRMVADLPAVAPKTKPKRQRYCGPCDRYVPAAQRECRLCGADTDIVPLEAAS